MRETVEGSPFPTGLPPQQKELKAEKKADAKSKAHSKVEPTQKYVMKAHKRKEKPTAFAIHNRTTNKQVGQLIGTVVEKADEKVDQLVIALNNGNMTESEVVDFLNKLKTGNQS